MTDPKHPLHKRSFFSSLRASFLTGLVVVIPIGLTIYLIYTVIGWVDSWVLPFVPQAYQPQTLLQDLLGEDTRLGLRGMGVIVLLIFTVIVGWIAKGIIGRSVLRYAESVVDRMPVVRTLYNGLKQIAETVFSQQDNNFERACLVEYPKEGIWAIGFISTKAKGEIAAAFPADDEVISVFLPTTPNPTSGFLLYVPLRDVKMLDMRIEDAAKLIISAGLVYPTSKGELATPKGEIKVISPEPRG